MSYSIESASIQDEAVVGEVVDVASSPVCNLTDGMCPRGTLVGEIDGKRFLESSLALVHDAVFTAEAGIESPGGVSNEIFNVEGYSPFGELSFNKPGTYTVEWTLGGDRVTDTITVEEQPPNFSVSGCSIQPQTVTEGDTVTLTATVSNTGGDGQATVTFSDESGTVASVQRSVPGGSNATVGVDLVYDTPGEYGISVDAS